MKITPESKILIQGVCEPLACYYATKMKLYGTNIVAGITVGQPATTLEAIPVFPLVEQAIATMGNIDLSLIFNHPYQVLDAALEAIACGIRQLIIVTGSIPPLDLVALFKKAEETKTKILGSGSSGLIIPEKFWIGTNNPQFYTPGSVGLISRTSILMDEIALTLTQAKIGQAIAVNLGADEILGTTFAQWLSELEQDSNTKAIVLIGQPAGHFETFAAEYIPENVKKPVIAYIPGENTPIDSSFKDAATIIATQLSSPVSATTSLKDKIEALVKADVKIAHSPAEIVALIQKIKL
jgi:succinyl-CoA synthetase alpha subunit